MSQNARTAAETRNYLRRILKMNPLEASGEIIALRDQYLGLAKTSFPSQKSLTPSDLSSGALSPDAAQEDLQQRREKTVNYLETLRAKFWDSDLARLQVVLEKLDIEPFPDLAQAVHRLKVVAAHRDRLREFESHKHFDADFYACLKRILILPTRGTAALREIIISKINDKNMLRRAKGMVKALKQELPLVYALESDWLDTILANRARATQPVVTSNQNDESESPGCNAAFTGLTSLLIIVGIAVIRGCVRNMD